MKHISGGYILRKSKIRQMRILKSLTVPKNVKGGPLEFLTSILLHNINKLKLDPLETLKNFQKSLTKPKKEGSLIVATK